MQIGIHLANLTWPGGGTEMASTIATIARTAESVGCEHESVMDHWFQMDQVAPVDNDMLEAYTTLGFLAAQTEDVLRRHCDEVGRNADDIKRTILYVGDALSNRDPDRFLAEMADYAKLGITTVVVMPLDADPVAFVEWFGVDLIPRLSEL